MKVCKTNGLHPVLLEAGIEGVWTPKHIPRIGYCDYGLRSLYPCMSFGGINGCLLRKNAKSLWVRRNRP